MHVKVIIKKGEYHDSVTLMRVAKTLSELPGVTDSAVVMATAENQKILEMSGLSTPELRQASETDLVIAVRAESAERGEALLAQAVRELKARKPGGGTALSATHLDGALARLPDANIALISIAGRYAGDEARKALERGLHVMLFSDNVSLETEIELKQFAQSRDLLVMGPDCGTAIINGVPLAFANQVQRGSIGVVAAAGTGAQEVTSLISNSGCGISQAIGTGGRDVKREVGGITFLQALDALIEDPQTEVLLLVSKPPHESVLKRIVDRAGNCKKAVVATFLGADPKLLTGTNIIATTTLEEGARRAVALATGRNVSPPAPEKSEPDFAQALAKKLMPSQKYLRGLYTGGTFVAETQLLLSETLTPIYSNAPAGMGKKLSNSLKSEGHTIIDFGEDEFTVGRPHPMIDFSLRNKRMIEEARDPEVGVLLMDLVLGWGANLDPLADFLPALMEAQQAAHKQGREICVIMNVTGTDLDPQNRSRVVSALRDAGVTICPSNASAARLAGATIQQVLA